MKAVLYAARTGETAEKKAEHRIGRQLLERGLRERYGVVFREELLAFGANGKPYLRETPEIHFNISHTRGCVLCLFAPCAVGIDVQRHRPVRLEAMLRRIVPEETAREILADKDRERRFFDEWALREAYLKWTGEGITRDLRTIDFSGGWHTLLSVGTAYSAAAVCAKALEIEWKTEEMGDEYHCGSR